MFASWWVIPSITGVSKLRPPDSCLIEYYRLEVAPLVVGVSGARHQSFPTEEEAMQAFRDEVMRGRVKVVNGGLGSPRPSYNFYPDFPSAPSTPRRSHSHGVSAGQSPFGNSNSPVRRANSDLSYADYGNMAEARHSERMTASPANSSAGYASLHSVSVRTPSGLGYYPETVSSPSAKTSRSLTPLASPKLSFGVEGTPKHTNVKMSPRHSRVQSPVRDPLVFPSIQGPSKRYVKAMVCDGCAEKAVQKCLCCNRTIGSGTSGRSLSGVFSSMQVSRRTVCDKQTDPRSPMGKEPYVPPMTR